MDNCCQNNKKDDQVDQYHPIWRNKVDDFMKTTKTNKHTAR